MAMLVEISDRVTAERASELFKVPADIWRQCMMLSNKDCYEFAKKDILLIVQAITMEMVRVFFNTEEWLQHHYGYRTAGNSHPMPMPLIKKIVRDIENVAVTQTIDETSICADVIKAAIKGAEVVIIDVEAFDVDRVPINIQIPDQQIHYTCCGIMFGNGNHFVADILHG